MKKSLQKLMLTMLIALGIVAQTKAQWITSGTFNNYFTQPDNTSIIPANWTRSIGIGYFNTAGTYPNSFLHVNTNGMVLPQNGSIISLGEVFRTDCPASTETDWRMFGGGTQYGRLFNSGSDGNFQLESSVNDMIFNTGGAYERMRILRANGYVGIGTSFPKAKLEVANGDIAVTTIGKGIILKATKGDHYYRITVDNTGKLNTELIENL